MKVEANGIEIHCELAGRGPAVLLSHSLASNLHMWNDQMAALTPRYRVLRFDTRGHGQTEAPGGAYTLEQMADDTRALLDALGIERVHFVGLSMGGMIAQTFALAHPERVESLVLADTSSRCPPEARALWEERIRIAGAQGMDPLVEPTLGRWFTAPFRSRRPEVVSRIGEAIRATPAAGYIGCCHAIPRIDLTRRLGDIECPALVIVGEEDPGTPVAMAREIAEALPSAELAIVPAASHLCNVEKPEAFNDLLLGFLDRVARHH